MARVEWSALGGDEVEALLSNLLYNADERAVRIRPAQGDYGIDVIVPTGGDPERWDVYQVKKFAQNLSANQKGQIENSFRRVLVGLVRRGVSLNDWYLVTPLDPTLYNLMDWFNDMPGEAAKTLFADQELALNDAEKDQIWAWIDTPGRLIDWKGLDFCQKLAADYPYVVDYYLHGGVDRVREAVADLAQLLGGDMALRNEGAKAQPEEGAAALMEPGEVREHLLRLDRVLTPTPIFATATASMSTNPICSPNPGWSRLPRRAFRTAGG